MNNVPFKKKLIVRAIASACLLGGSSIALGQDTQNSADLITAQSPGPVLEEVVVTGIRSSLQRSMDVKRMGQGVVDAISAEDIGKMPDTNLAESLQRITGVSIDRVNGEGSRVTVRGFGPDYNVIALNGRQMPAANLEDTTASASRSFNFQQLAAESVRGVQIYKTGRADLPTGGIGSVINIQTARPLEIPEGIMSFGAKAHHDTTNEDGGDDWTPEVSGIYSDTFADGTFGVALSASYSARDSGYAQAGTTSGWYTIPGGQGDWGSVAPDDPNWVNAPQAGEIYSVPRNINYAFGQVQRERTNAQLTLQWEPIDSVTATLDYTYSNFDVEQQVHDMGAWFNGVPVSGEFSTGSIKAPLIYTDATGADVTFGAGDWGRENELNSVGFNVVWRATDNLQLAFDYHNSEAENKAKDDRGTNNIVSGVQFSRMMNTANYSQQLPVLTLGLSDPLDPSRMITSGTSFRNSYMKHEIEQAQFTGVFEFDDSMIRSIDFGISLTESTNRSAYSNAQRDTWGGYGAAADYDDGIFRRNSLPGQFDELSGANNPDLEPFYYESSFNGMINAISAIATANGETLSPCGTTLCASPFFDTDREVKEDQMGIYAQVNFAWEDAAMPMHLTVGLRYEETDVDAKAFVPLYDALVWAADNEFSALSTGGGFTNGEGSYDNWLPNIDFDIEVVEDVVLRASSSVTITRPSYNDLQGGKTIANPVRFNGGIGNSGNPNLKPFESTNFDFSGEWYYGEGSYVSVGYYFKDVENFIGNTTVNEAVFDLAHPAQGPRYAAAVAELGTDDASAVRAYMESLYGAPVAGDASQGDPFTVFSLVTPVNVETAEIDGWEIALQHMFWDSGFGVILNYTTVEGDIGYDNFNTNKGEGAENQFALLGLSDSYNIVGFYDKHGIQARIAYNWRDEFLTNTLDGNGERNPVYTEDYGQVDVSISYELPQVEGLTLLAEGINVTNETLRTYGRTEDMVINALEQGARYSLGIRYQF
jgi:TonB-dependent receptor